MTAHGHKLSPRGGKPTSGASHDAEYKADKATSQGSYLGRSHDRKVLPKVVKTNNMSWRTRLRSHWALMSRTEPRDAARLILESTSFDACIGCVIVCNSATIGLEPSMASTAAGKTFTQILENLFLVIYILEFGLRLYAFGKDCLKDNWVKFDVFLIVIGVSTSWVLEPALGGTSAFGPLMVLRMARLMRVAKTARLFKRAREFWRLVRGVLNSAEVLLYILIVLFVTLYIFSCIANEIITNNPMAEEDEEFRELRDSYFAGLPRTLVTLLRFATLDGMSEVYAPLIERDPWLVFYFVPLILIVSMLLFHLVGATIFSSSQEQNIEEVDEDKENEMQLFLEFVTDLKNMFLRLDNDSSGTLSLEEFVSIHPSDMALLQKGLGGKKTPMAVFKALDMESSGEVSIVNFFDEIWDVIQSQGGLDVKRMEKQVEIMNFRLKELVQGQQYLDAQMKEVLASVMPEEDLQEIGQRLAGKRSLFSSSASVRKTSKDSVSSAASSPKESPRGSPGTTETDPLVLREACQEAVKIVLARQAGRKSSKETPSAHSGVRTPAPNGGEGEAPRNSRRSIQMPSAAP
mmetsp:Transcript_66738/g.118061  ORF Transcript_66738/g.118061 Transcript_66738/m.118061 type:complete len:575 (+) Transcript_66738:128-1852(+)|eukprot:CAMPEP_0197679270 /NCGR_PEP_ID=MMETSP1338-20131121/91417_1 /TAXON_ID=43686 ORGANISM="Pelagodinium beii, Strain RCC1491" /NCGR_SAMPLE_ID=MMETSP1338 /ASSEMBLY_ACC=CAM_ASM_000754 /LENGTH=574 /DNA_ID=CAMNT_0043260309 /DNA_START=121 /DNA_END=1845 /DNA_ORIENTATION=+